jgi:hypothetical protein
LFKEEVFYNYIRFHFFKLDFLIQSQHFNFTRSFRKILLTDDVPNLGFRGEVVFVKPGYALNHLVPSKKAIFSTDPDCANIAK